MVTKCFEVRDVGTTIPMLAIKISGSDSRLIWRAGFGPDQSYVLLINLTNMDCQYDTFGWNRKQGRTIYIAHEYIKNYFDALADGAVVDIQFIQGETRTPKRSEFDKEE